MKKLFLFLILLVSLTNCKKQALDSTHPLVGKWRMMNFDIERICNINSNTYNFNGADIKRTIMEISNSGQISVTYEGVKQKLKIVEIEEQASEIEFIFFGQVLTEYKCKVKNKKGQTFSFRFYFKNDGKEMVGTYWTPNHAYHSLDLPNYRQMVCSYGTSSENVAEELFTSYFKIP